MMFSRVGFKKCVDLTPLNKKQQRIKLRAVAPCANLFNKTIGVCAIVSETSRKRKEGFIFENFDSQHEKYSRNCFVRKDIHINFTT